MKVLMINPNRYKWNVSPIGLEYVCNSLLREKIEFELVDLNFESERVIYRKIGKNNIDIVGITVRNIDSTFLPKIEFFIPEIKKLVERIKNISDCKVVLGGVGFSIMPGEVLGYTGADFGVVGYGEEAMPKLVRTLREGGSLANIDNLIWRKNGELQMNRISTGNYENTPPKRRNIVRNQSYYRVYGVGNIETMRGCINRCGYCTMPNVDGCRVVTRKIANVIEELKELKSLGNNFLYFADTEFNMASRKHLIEFCEKLVSSNMGIRWTASIHPNPKMLSRKLLYLMKEAGCSEVQISADSGSNDILASMEKRHTAEDTIICSELFRKANIGVFNFYILGWPGESLKTIDETIAHIKRCQADQVVIHSGVRIFPNTKIARIARAEGAIRENTSLLNPVYYKPQLALEEFLPYLCSRIKGLPNAFAPFKAIDFIKLFQQNVYKSGEFMGGLIEFVDYVNSISWQKKFNLLGKTILDYSFPFRTRFIPVFE